MTGSRPTATSTRSKVSSPPESFTTTSSSFTFAPSTRVSRRISSKRSPRRSASGFTRAGSISSLGTISRLLPGLGVGGLVGRVRFLG
ncbi:MAG: hypothetical protein EA421_12070 [Gemmatimonadales bacterium]|nr:MAG: hypothetical protein EA421_12070 [Gemmatimonadales bacterium]